MPASQDPEVHEYEPVDSYDEAQEMNAVNPIALHVSPPVTPNIAYGMWSAPVQSRALPHT